MNDRQPPKRDSATRHKQSNRRIDPAEVKTAADGRWVDLLTAAGLPEGCLDGRPHPCPQPDCRGRNRFAAWRDVNRRGAVHCRRCFTRGSKLPPGDGLATLQWWLDCDFPTALQWAADWLGLVNNLAKPRRPAVTRSIFVASELATTTKSKPTDDRLGELARGCHAAMRPAWWDRLADRLALPVESLQRLRVGWSPRHDATTWPMFDGNRRVIGVRLRSIKSGQKWSIRGGCAGVFWPTGLQQSPPRLFIAEGPTDAGALLSLGLPAIGRASAGGSIGLETSVIRRIDPSEAVIVADADEAGRKGARLLLAALVVVCPSVRIIAPPTGDARDWISAGATVDDVTRLVDRSTPRRLCVESTVRRGSAQ